MPGSPSPLLAPAAVTVEISADDRSDFRRIFRLARALGETEVVLVRPAPFEPDRVVTVSFTEPDGPGPLHLRARVTVSGEPDEEEGHKGGKRLVFLDPPADARARLGHYVGDRLGLLPPPGANADTDAHPLQGFIPT